MDQSRAADAAEGVVLAMERYDASDPVNLGNGMEISIADLATLWYRSQGNLSLTTAARRQG